MAKKLQVKRQKQGYLERGTSLRRIIIMIIAVKTALDFLFSFFFINNSRQGKC
jgi:hypothetical protein